MTRLQPHPSGWGFASPFSLSFALALWGGSSNQRDPRATFSSRNFEHENLEI